MAHSAAMLPFIVSLHSSLQREAHASLVGKLEAGHQLARSLQQEANELKQTLSDKDAQLVRGFVLQATAVSFVLLLSSVCVVCLMIKM